MRSVTIVFRYSLFVLLAIMVSATGALAQSQFLSIADSTMTPPDGGSYGFLGSAHLNNNGLVVFDSDKGVYAGNGTTTRNLFHYNANAPGGGIFTQFGRSGLDSLNDSGMFAFEDQVFAAAGPFLQRQGLFATDGTTTKLIMFEGQMSPDGSTFQFFFNQSYSPSINNAGQVTFFSSTDTHRADGGLFRIAGNTTTMLVEGGESAPGGGTFATFDGLQSNNNGQVTFAAGTSGGIGAGIFRLTGATDELLVSKGEDAPGGGQFRGFLYPTINDGGVVAFRGSTTNGPAQGIYRTDGITASLIAAVGETAPGGETIQGLSALVAINAADHVAFATLNGLSGASMLQGLYIGDGLGTMKVIGLGDTLFSSTVIQLSFDNGSFNNSDELAFSYSLEDGRNGIALWTGGFFVGSAAPEPASFALFGLVTLPMIGMLRRARHVRSYP